MLVFIDDSGDPSFKIDKGASKNFVICCVIFDDDLEADIVAGTIRRYKEGEKENSPNYFGVSQPRLY